MLKTRFQKLAAVLTAAAALTGVCSLGASAEDIMTFRTAQVTERQYLKEADFLNNGASLPFAVYVDNYSGLSRFKLTLDSDKPLTISNSGYSSPALFSKFAIGDGESGNTQSAFYHEDAEGNPINVAVYFNDYDGILPYPNAEIANEGGSLLSFNVNIPKGIKAGVYQVGCKEGFLLNSVGQKEYYCYAFDRDSHSNYTIQNAQIVIEPDNYLRGDVDFDGDVDDTDAVAVLRYLAGSILELPQDMLDAELGTPYIHGAKLAGDVDENGELNEVDAAAILTYYAHEILMETPDWDEILGD